MAVCVRERGEGRGRNVCVCERELCVRQRGVCIGEKEVCICM